ncbi:hypothetical protein CR513_47405, partial [Mucuna pruriens]
MPWEGSFFLQLPDPTIGGPFSSSYLCVPSRHASKVARVSFGDKMTFVLKHALCPLPFATLSVSIMLMPDSFLRPVHSPLSTEWSEMCFYNGLSLLRLSHASTQLFSQNGPKPHKHQIERKCSSILTLVPFVIGNVPTASSYASPMEDPMTVSGSSVEERSPSGVPELEGPFRVWYCEEKDAEGSSKGPKRDLIDPLSYSWVDGNVLEVSSNYTKARLLDGLIHYDHLPSPWSIQLLPCRSGEYVCKGADGEELYIFLEFGLLKGGLVIPKQSVYYYGDDQNFLLNQRGEPHFSLFWTKTPTTSIRVKRSCVEPWEENFLVKLIDRHISSCSALLKTGLDVATRKALRKQKQASSNSAPSLGSKATTSRPKQDVAPPATTHEAGHTPITANEWKGVATSLVVKEASTSD